VQDVSKSPQRLLRGGRARICIDFHRDRLVGMPQDSHDHARMQIEVNEQRGTSVPGVMNNEPTHAPGLAARREFSVESAGIDESAMKEPSWPMSNASAAPISSGVPTRPARSARALRVASPTRSCFSPIERSRRRSAASFRGKHGAVAKTIPRRAALLERGPRVSSHSRPRQQGVRFVQQSSAKAVWVGRVPCRR
jgi:hypothetical protein